MNTEQKKYTIKEIEKCNNEEKDDFFYIFCCGVITLLGTMSGVSAFQEHSLVFVIYAVFSVIGGFRLGCGIADLAAHKSKRELLEYQLKMSELEEYDNQEENKKRWVKTR